MSDLDDLEDIVEQTKISTGSKSTGGVKGKFTSAFRQSIKSRLKVLQASSNNALKRKLKNVK